MTDPGPRAASATASPRRLADRATFERLRREGARGASGPVSVLWLAEEGHQRRVAYAVGRRVGGAVVRNRIRRRLRAIVAGAAAAEMAPGAWLVRVQPEAAAASFDELERHLRSAVASASRRSTT